MAVIGLSTALSWLPCGMSEAAGLPPPPPAAKLCDADCERELESVSPNCILPHRMDGCSTVSRNKLHLSYSSL